jgi:hypothetical protein
MLISVLGIDKVFSPILKYTQNRASSEWSLRLAGAEKRLEERRWRESTSLQRCGDDEKISLNMNSVFAIRLMLSLAIRSPFSASCPNLRALSRSPPLCADVRDL